MKIALTGSGSTGKSTLASAVHDAYGVPVIPEFAREVIKEMGYSTIKELPPERSYDFQMRVLGKKIQAEDAAESFIGDRCTVDALAYFLRWTARDATKEQAEDYIGTCVAQLQKYTHIIVLPWNSLPLVEDGFRSVRPYYQYSIHVSILGLLEDHGIPYWTMPYKTLADRIRYFEQYFS